MSIDKIPILNEYPEHVVDSVYRWMEQTDSLLASLFSCGYLKLLLIMTQHMKFISWSIEQKFKGGMD